MDQERFFKVLNEDGSAFHGGLGVWPLPSEDGPGEWLEVKGQLVKCSNGLHVCRPQDLRRWLGPAIFEVEIDIFAEEPLVESDKVVVRRARLLRRTAWGRSTAVTFAADCAERVLSIYEEHYPDDDRPRKAIAAARADAAAFAAAASASFASAAASALRRYRGALVAEAEWQTQRIMELLA